MAVQAGAVYNGSFYSRGHFVGTFTVSLVSDITGQVLASANISSRSVAQSWTQHTYELVPAESAANANNSFVLSYHAAAGTVLNFNLISLFPPTYKKR